MPTTRGWAALGAAAALVLLWIGFGERLMLAVAVFLFLAIALGMVYVRLAVPRVGVGRRLTPRQVHDGDRAIVEITLVSRRRIYQVAIEDEVHGLGAAHFVAERVDPEEPMVARYEILSRPRGVYRVGPAKATVRDPLGLTEAGGPAGATDRLVVYPSVEDLDGIPVGRGQDPTVNMARASFSHSGGDDFFTLRDYQHGDDLRKVHWPTTARRDHLMIRQMETPWQSRALVLLDSRQSAYPTPEMFEHAVRAAASSVRHLFSRGHTPTLWAGMGNGTTVGTSEGYAIAMEELATVQTQDGRDLRAAVSRLRRLGLSGGILILITGPPDDGALGIYRVIGRDFNKTLVMAVAEGENEAILHFARAGALTVRSMPGTLWAPAWREAMERSWSTATAG